MSNHQDPAEQLLDVFVYAPLGLALEAVDLLPRLVEKGRRRAGGNVTVARMVGELAVRQGQRKVEKLVGRLRDQQRDTPPSTAAPGATGAEGPASPRGSRPATGLVTDFGPASPGPAAAPHPGVRPDTADPTPPAGDLAIPGFDTLSASQVVPRLEGLSPDELDAIRRYEEAHRARKTVLTRIDQLGGAAG